MGALDDWTLYLVCGAVPAVVISAPTPLRGGEPTDERQLPGHRTVVTADPLTVTLQYFGSATSGVDYTTLPATVTILGNQPSVLIRWPRSPT